MCRSDSESVRREAVWAVAKFRKAEDSALLKKSAQDEAPVVRTVAAMALTRIMARADLGSWLHQNLPRLSIEALVEFDFALYSPRWLAKANPRIGNQDLGAELGMIRHHCTKW